MAKFTRNLIEYSGKFNEYYCKKTNNTFKQSTIDVNFCIDDCKAPIKDILKMSVDTKISSFKVVKTSVGTSVEGQIITGNKLMVIGEFTLKATYIADTLDNRVESYTVIIPFCDYIVLPNDFECLTIAKPEIYVEDMYIKKSGDKCIFGNITYLAQADIC
ncbi:MAG: hypothetical protein R3Y12_05665 [Clostridia bacterium]